MELGFKGYLTAAIGYSVSVSALYLFGYWGAFDLNVLEYVSFTDIARLAIYPLLATLFFILLGLLQGQLFAGDVFPVGSGADTAVGRFGRSYWRPILYVISTALVAIAVTIDSSAKWAPIAIMAAILTIPIGHMDVVMKWLPHPSIRFNLLFVTTMVSVLAFGTGRSNATDALNGTAPLIVDVQRSGLILAETTEKPVIYLGLLGEYFVVLETTSSHVVLISEGKIELLHLVRNPNRVKSIR